VLIIISSLVPLLGFLAFVGIIYRYRRPKPGEALVRTGGRGAKVTITGGMWVNRIFHEIRSVSLNTVRIEVSREGQDALITRDFNRADIKAVFYVRIEPVEEQILRAAQSLGKKALTPETIQEFVKPKAEGVLRAVVAAMKIEDLVRKRDEFAKAVLKAIKDDLSENGLTLESAVITRIDQTPIGRWR
jgi:uncharacterized membrane protein YqiK